jgi:hypothetical protein
MPSYRVIQITLSDLHPYNEKYRMHLTFKREDSSLDQSTPLVATGSSIRSYDLPLIEVRRRSFNLDMTLI